MMDSEFMRALSALENPIQFAARDDFERLDRVKGLENTLARAAGQARALAPSAETAALLEGFVDALPSPQESREARILALRACLTSIAKIRTVALEPKEKVEAVRTSVKRDVSRSSSQPLRPDTPIQFVKGVGPKTAQALGARSIRTAEELLRFLPRRYETCQSSGTLADVTEGVTTTVEGQVLLRSDRRFRGKRTLEVAIGDDTATISLKWFRVPGGGFADRFKKGAWLSATGSVTRYRSKLQIVHPETKLLPDGPVASDTADEAGLVPAYLEVEGVRPKKLRAIIDAALRVAPLIEDRVPVVLRERHDLPTLGEALIHLHQPDPDLSPEVMSDMATPWHRRLIYEELLMLQLVVLRRRASASEHGGLGIQFEAGMKALARELFPFELTKAQARVLEELQRDLVKTTPMHRLLQGDVGSGKTAVALCAAAAVAQAGHQTAIVAPTELLAEQHARNAHKFLAGKARVGLLTGKLSAAERRRVLGEIERGDVDVVVGTHALLQQGVTFSSLVLGIVDEQHRFGVLQRARVIELGRASAGKTPHVLVMTATPIPRTLALTVYGDLDVSLIDELPPGRTPVVTKVFRDTQRERVYRMLRSEVEAGRQAYVVLPLVEESDKESMQSIRDATGTADELAHGILHGLRVGLLHGKMSSDDKDRMMRCFIRHEVDVLVSTTVIEVGIDVPNATVMVVEHAERFGLSQLHQLRGRVGRGAHESSCYLVARFGQSEDAARRLGVMERSTDGFVIAEEDLAIRGPGDFVGTRQSGLPLLTVADLARDQKLMLAARDDAREILERDPELLEPEHTGMRALLESMWNARLELAKIG